MKHALIVDDHAENLYMLRALLQGSGFSVAEARHGEEALALAQQQRPDVVISDLLMPVMDGYTLLRHWKTAATLKEIPFVVYTATYTDPRDERLARDLGADAFLVKPAEPEPILACLQEVLARQARAETCSDRAEMSENVLLSEYSEVLVRKLEQKVLALEQSNRELTREIAERTQTEAALRDSEERYRGLFDAVSDPLFVYDRETLAYLAVNAAAVAKYGYSRDEFLRMTLKELRPPEEVPALLEALPRQGTAPAERGIWHHRTKAGAILEVAISTYGLDFAGRPACLVQARDVTEQRRAEAEVVRTTELLQAVANGTPDVVYLKDRQGRYLLFNEAGSRYVGRAVAQVLGQDDTALFSPEDAQAIQATDRRVMESNQSHTIEESLQTALGRRAFQTIKAPYRDTQGQVLGVIGITRDITAQQQAAEALQLRDRALHAVSQGILIADARQPDHPIIYASAGFERMTGYRADEVLGRNCRFLQGPATDRAAVADLRAALAAGRGCSVELLNYRKDGTTFWNALTISPVGEPGGTLTHFIGVQTDVTARRRLEEQFHQAQKLEAIGRLAAGVAHDFNNLLTIIGGYSDLLLESAAVNEAAQDMLLEIRKAGDRAAALTRQLLAFSRQQVLEPKVVDLNSVISETERMLCRLIGEDLRLVTRLSPHLGRVRADPGQIEQVLLNLAVNARDAMPKGGTLTIQTQPVCLEEAFCRGVPDLTPGSYVLLTVRDTGCGMDETILTRLFEPFFTTKEKGKGTGLGLATVHGIIKQSRGHVMVESELGRGTAFHIYLPQVTAPLSGERAALPPAILQGTETVLLVEDEEAVRGVASHILRGCGYRVLEAGDGMAALRLAQSERGPIHLLISDVVMPHLGGRALAESLLRARPECRVLFLSGYTDDAVLRQDVSEAEVAFLQKPFTSAGLAQKVRRLLDAPPRLMP